MVKSIREYSVPVLLAVLLHGFAAASAYVLDASDASSKNSRVFEPKTISVSLLILERETRTTNVSPNIQDKLPSVGVTPETSDEEGNSDLPDEFEQTEEERQALEQLRLEELRNRVFDQGLLRESEDLQDFTFDEESTSYVNAIYSAIVVKWSRPPSATRDMETVLQVELFPSGELDTVELLESSGHDAFDRSTIAAVEAVKKFTVPKNSELFERRFRSINLRFRGEDLLR
jgi:colicin import membrane protein